MSKGRLLIVEDDIDISSMLSIYFESQSYDVDTAGLGKEALDKCKRNLPNLVILDILLPDIDGYEVCRQLRANLRTSHIPIIFLTQKDERSDQIVGLELGADDYITKPFDLQLLMLRVHNSLQRAAWLNLTSPVTGLPSSKLIEDQLRQLIRKDDWSILYAGIRGIDAFNDAYGFVAGDDLLRFTALIMGEVIDQLGTGSDFVGHVGSDNFIIMSGQENGPVIQQQLVERFNREVLAHYSYRDRERGWLEMRDEEGRIQKRGLMKLAVGLITSDDGPFSDIREVTEAAAEARRAAD
jgi:PleD family two-component response regulator